MSPERPPPPAGNDERKPGQDGASKKQAEPPPENGGDGTSPDDNVPALRSAARRLRGSVPTTAMARRVPDRAQQDAWVRGLQARDEDSLREVIAAFSERITAVASGILKDQDAVEDVVQATFTKAWYRIRTFRGGSGLYTWLYRVAVNTCKDHIKGRKRRPASTLDEQQAARLPSDAPHVLEGLERRELRLRVRRAIGDLPERYRIVLALRELEGMSYGGIAEVTGLSLGTVESRLFRARRRLRERLTHGRESRLRRPRGREEDKR